MFDGQLLVECRDFIFKLGQRALALAVGQFGANAVFGRAQLLDVPHRVMNGTKLPLKLGEQIELIDGQHFCIELEELAFAFSLGRFHMGQCIKVIAQPASRRKPRASK